MQALCEVDIVESTLCESNHQIHSKQSRALLVMQTHKLKRTHKSVVQHT
ncbi:hypothetical protein HMPREF3192_00386 [Atopobium deltae]|uniref:Uncharacterized protein n=1 Tax=Atopobium deltae TaxID=1393034 RepID=A0A133XWH8_9ACTN|nr:hypothetical protein HMPREF3192_00386 [Atopobium deltae]